MIKTSKCWTGIAALGIILLGGGCGGFSGSPSVSPATFLMPGLLQAPPPQSPSPTQPAPLLVQSAPAR